MTLFRILRRPRHGMTLFRILTRMAAMLALAVMSVAPASAASNDFPNRPLKLIIPFATGGAVTFLTEHIMKEMEQELGQPAREAVDLIGGPSVARRRPAHRVRDL